MFGSRTGACRRVLCYILPRSLLKTGLPDKWSQWDQVELVPVLSDECSGCAVGHGRERTGTPGGFSAFPDGWDESFATPQTRIPKSKCLVLQIHRCEALFGESVAS